MGVGRTGLARHSNGPLPRRIQRVWSQWQYIIVLPAPDAVIVHKVDFDADAKSAVTPDEFSTILQMLIVSVCGDICK